MSHYRDLNKELVEQVQTMRKTMKLYCDEIVFLKGELMQKHESLVFLKKECYNWAVNNFVQLIQCVQPDSDILSILKDHVNTEEGITCTSNERRNGCRTRSSFARRQSSLLTRDFRRSSSILQLRKSVRSTSPIRRSNHEDSDEYKEAQNSQIMSIDSDELENADIADNKAIQNEVAQTVRNDEIANIIFEESDEAADEETNHDEDLDVESVYESVEEVSITISEQRSALNNITNSLKSTKFSSRRQNIQAKQIFKKVRPKRTKKKNLSDKENSTDEYTTSKEDSDIDTTRKQNMTRQTGLTDKSNKKDVEEETLQEPRRYSNSRCNFDTSKSFHLNQNQGQISKNEVTLSSTTFVLTDITLKNFKDVASSTPNSRKNSIEATTPTTQSQTASTMQTSSSNISSTRPSRHCKPKNLAEPSLNKKLRNEFEKKSKSSNSRKAKSKTKK